MTMGNRTQNSSPRKPTWTTLQAYALAAYCLVMGIAVGYLFHGSASPVSVTSGSTSASPSNPPAALQQQFDAQQHATFVDQSLAPMVEQLKNNPNDFDTIVKIANLYYDAKQYQQAIAYYERGLKIQPENVDVRTDMGTAYWYLGDADRAISEFRKSLKYKPGHPETLFNLGVVQWQGKNDSKAAVQAWDQLLKSNPDYPRRQQVEEFIEQVKQHAQG
jgi:cytochrome c-type biogenesis protein CcmH/NrfG